MTGAVVQPESGSAAVGRSAGASGAPLRRLTELLGEDAFFVPCEWGTKKPLVTYVERPFEGTKSPAYRALFEMVLHHPSQSSHISHRRSFR